MTRAAHRHAASGAGHVPTAPTDAQRERLARIRAALELPVSETRRRIARAMFGHQSDVGAGVARSARGIASTGADW